MDDSKRRNFRVAIGGLHSASGVQPTRAPPIWRLDAGDADIRMWIAPSFGDVFFYNSFKNGFLQIVLPPERFATALRMARQRTPGAEQPGGHQ